MMEMNKGEGIEKINSKIEDLKSQLETAGGDAKQKIEEEIKNLEDERDQMMAYAESGGEKMKEDIEDII